MDVTKPYGGRLPPSRGVLGREPKNKAGGQRIILLSAGAKTCLDLAHVPGISGVRIYLVWDPLRTGPRHTHGPGVSGPGYYRDLGVADVVETFV